ncbi:eukaryotic translation initiation factor 3 subunit J isoform X2 [Diorhabda sublineata]|uniref:eukaryotic translation initiation factor 3 subunit J isoform X2 n=1 Tax=Diorhabda sublineata TaxID=1163346 RepID=UPI0024E084CE|nr:eukaryotic translation initiation factor 3 subunit J isoform X2 [Diorhabda sublineata]
MESWDEDTFEPTVPSVVPVASNKWEGEDEEEDVKESWEDEDEEKKEEIKVETEPKKPKKKPLAEKIAEKERLKREEMERRLREEAEEDISPEEKLRRQQESDLKLALETTFGGNKSNEVISDISLPNSTEEFEAFTDTLSKKLTPLSKSTEYPTFVENLTRNLCATMSSLDIKKVKNSLDNLFLEKQKIEKGDKAKKNKGKGKAKLHIEGDNQLSQLSAYVDDYNEYDDFM